jgi:hypothetical protein
MVGTVEGVVELLAIVVEVAVDVVKRRGAMLGRLDDLDVVEVLVELLTITVCLLVELLSISLHLRIKVLQIVAKSRVYLLSIAVKLLV